MYDATGLPTSEQAFLNVVQLSFAAYSQYDPITKTGNPVTIIIDDLVVVRHIGGVF